MPSNRRLYLKSPRSRGCAGCCEDLGHSLVEWFGEATDEQLNELCEAFNCNCHLIDVHNSLTVNLTGDGTSYDPLTADLNVAPDSDNAVEVHNNGVYVQQEQYTKSHTSDTVTVHLTGDGTTGNPLEAEAQVSADMQNALTIKPDGLFTHVSNMTWDNGDKTITFTNNEGDDNTIDLSQFAVDMHVDGASFDTNTLILTLNVADGGGTITVDLKELSKSTTSDTKTITWTGDGSPGNPLKAQVQICNDNDSFLEIGNDGLCVILEDAFGDPINQN